MSMPIYNSTRHHNPNTPWTLTQKLSVTPLNSRAVSEDYCLTSLVLKRIVISHCATYNRLIDYVTRRSRLCTYRPVFCMASQKPLPQSRCSRSDTLLSPDSVAVPTTWCRSNELARCSQFGALRSQFESCLLILCPLRCSEHPRSSKKSSFLKQRDHLEGYKPLRFETTRNYLICYWLL
jgi:hypothetical protein